jgi:hypothetical protein
VFIKRSNSVLLLVFNVKCPNPSSLGIEVTSGDNVLSGWTNPWQGSRSKLWIMNFCDTADNNTSLSGSLLKEEFDCDSVTLSTDSVHNYFPRYFDEESKVNFPLPLEFYSTNDNPLYSLPMREIIVSAS